MADSTPWQPLWPQGAPLALGDQEHDIPALRYYAPEESNGCAILVLPGGGYQHLAGHEGEGYARWFAGMGYHAFELRYRLGLQGYRHPAMWLDASRAMRVVRSQAADIGFDSGKVGIIGSSAGGHLTAHLTVRNDEGDAGAADPIDRLSSRPSLSILCYPVIHMASDLAHAGSRKNLLGESPESSLCAEVSPERHVAASTPPCFLWHTVEDTAVDVENSLDFAKALRRAKVPFELHVYEKGRHGLGLADGHPWTEECARWVRETFLLQG